MYAPKDTAELRNVLEALRTFTSIKGMSALSEVLEDAEITLAMEELNSPKDDTTPLEAEEPASG